MSLKLLLTDDKHPLGDALVGILERETVNLLLPTADEVDWSDAKAVAAYIQYVNPDVVINTQHCSFEPSDQQCELMPKVAANIASACAKIDRPMVQLSSYRVFGGDNKSTHTEKDEPEPTSTAGKAFLKTEENVARRLEKHINLRFSWVIASEGDNLLAMLLSKLLKHEPWVLNQRVRGAPTLLSDAARVIVTLVKQIGCGAQNWGVMQYCSGDACTEVVFAEKLLEALERHSYKGKLPVLEEIDEVPVDIPVSAVLSSRRIRDSFGVQPRAWQPAIQPTIEQWLKKNSAN